MSLGVNAFIAPRPASEAQAAEAVSSSSAAAGSASSEAPLVPATFSNETTAKAPSTAPAPVADNTPPTIGPSGPGGGVAQYLTAGAVIAEVNGRPIYADQVLESLTPALATEAKQRDLKSFTEFAAYQIGIKVFRDLIPAEVLYATASEGLTADERARVDAIIMGLRQQQVTAAQGSESLARRRAEAEGVGFDEQLRDLSRLVTSQMWIQRKVRPRVNVTADEMREYYDRHVATEFTETAMARYRVIRINAKDMDADLEKGRSLAIDKIKAMHDQAASQSDAEFAKMAGSINHDPGLRKASGLVGAAEGSPQGTYAVTPVEEAVWKLQPGEVTEPIQVGDSYFIARLEMRKPGHVKPFEDQEVQARIKTEIEDPLIASRTEELKQNLWRAGVVYPDPNSVRDPDKRAEMVEEMIRPVVEMAIQKYPEWAAKK
jgi:parvulin-like peptidyl-prolyl isomerase